MHCLPVKRLFQRKGILATAQLPYAQRIIWYVWSIHIQPVMFKPTMAPVPERSQVTYWVAYCCHVVHLFHKKHWSISEVASQRLRAVTSALSLLLHVVLSVSQLRVAMTTYQWRRHPLCCCCYSRTLLQN